MNKKELLEYYDKFKDCATGQLLTLEDLFRMFEAVRERNENAVSQD